MPKIGGISEAVGWSKQLPSVGWGANAKNVLPQLPTRMAQRGAWKCILPMDLELTLESTEACTNKGSRHLASSERNSCHQETTRRVTR